MCGYVILLHDMADMGSVEAHFLGFCRDFLTRNPGYYVQPVRINGSVVESPFSRFKYHANGNLSSVNYHGCVAK